MKRWIIVCALLVLVQAGLTLWTNFGQSNDGVQSAKGPLLAVQAGAINGLQLEDNQGHTLVLTKVKEHWVLPASGNFPADSIRIKGLIDQLVALQRGWPEATTTEAATRFKVAPENFVHKLTLFSGDKPLKVIYFGSSPGLRKLYLRVEKDPQIHAMTLAPRDLETTADDWIDTTVLHLKAEQIARVHLSGLELEQGKDGLQPVPMEAGEELRKEQRDMLVNRLTGLSISAILGEHVKPEYGLDHPAFAYDLTLKDGTTITYQFGQKPKPAAGKDGASAQMGDNSYVVKVSNQKQLLRVDGWQVDELKTATRAGLVKAKAAAPAKVPEAQGVPASAAPLPGKPSAASAKSAPGQ